MRFAISIVAALATLVAGNALPIAEPVPAPLAMQTFRSTAANVSLVPDDGHRYMFCDLPGWKGGSCWFMRKGVDYLRKLGNHNCHVDAHSAVRISCEYGAGIWFQSFTDQAYDVPCSELGDWAWEIIRMCGGDKCINDQRKPGTLVYGALETAKFSISLQLQYC